MLRYRSNFGELKRRAEDLAQRRERRDFEALGIDPGPIFAARAAAAVKAMRQVAGRPDSYQPDSYQLNLPGVNPSLMALRSKEPTTAEEAAAAGILSYVAPARRTGDSQQLDLLAAPVAEVRPVPAVTEAPAPQAGPVASPTVARSTLQRSPMNWFQRLEEGGAGRLQRLRERIAEGDAQVGQLAGLVRLQAETGGVERNRERLLNAPEAEVMQRLMAEQTLKRDSVQADRHRQAIRMGVEAREKHFRGYAPEMNRGPMGIGRQGLLEATAGGMENHLAARVAGLYAPAALLGAAGLTAVGQDLLDLIARRENATATLAELDRAAAAARKAAREQ